MQRVASICHKIQDSLELATNKKKLLMGKKEFRKTGSLESNFDQNHLSKLQIEQLRLTVVEKALRKEVESNRFELISLRTHQRTTNLSFLKTSFERISRIISRWISLLPLSSSIIDDGGSGGGLKMSFESNMLGSASLTLLASYQYPQPFSCPSSLSFSKRSCGPSKWLHKMLEIVDGLSLPPIVQRKPR
ncbi:hypothetical protein Tco_0317994 [Tanacetum coccineum]